MTNTDMVIFRSTSPPDIIDAYSYSWSVPKTDSINNYETISSSNNATHANIIVERPL